MDNTKFRTCNLRRGEFKFRCEKCGHRKLIRENDYHKLIKSYKIRVKCICGDIQYLLLEKRSNNRKVTELQGVFYHIASNNKPIFGDINITNISAGGMCFQPNFQLRSSPAIGSSVLIKFNPNSILRSLVTKTAAIKNIRNNCYHVEFVQTGKA